MSEQPDRPTHRRRRRASAVQGAPPARTEPPHDDQPRPPARQAAATDSPRRQAAPAQPRRDRPTGRRGHRPGHDPVESAMRDLAGSGSSQVGTSAAMRARDVNRPSEADLEAAEREVVIVRRHWRPAGD